jgi:hypothetical protein
MIPSWVRPLFVIAALYDLVLGLVFTFAFRGIYSRFGIALPNHDAYVQLPGMLIAIFGLGFWFVAQDPVRQRTIIVLGVLLKLAFSGVVFYHRLFHSIPDMWVPFAVIDLLFMVGFLAALRGLPAGGNVAR